MVKRRARATYQKSSPVDRLLRNVRNVLHHADLADSKLRSWSSSGSPEIKLGIVLAGEIVKMGTDLGRVVEKLRQSGFSPPKKSCAVEIYEGDVVAVRESHRQKYEIAFREAIDRDPEMLDGLEVSEVLPTRDLAVRRGRSKFIVRKSHVRKVG